MPQMYSALLSVLVFGLVPAAGTVAVSPSETAARLAIEPPPSLEMIADPRALNRLLSASGVTVVDLENAGVVFDRSAGTARPMGSLTKLMTALLLSEGHDLDEVVTITEAVKGVEGTVSNIQPGEQYTVGDLLSALLLSSANDAAFALAVHHSGTVPEFVRAMNDRAQSLGLHDTVFANPAGLDHPTQRSSPRDLAWLTAYAWKIPAVHERMAEPSATITSLAGRTIALQHTHVLLQKSEVLGGKTGTTAAAQQCLSSIIQIGSRQYVVVLLHSLDRYGDMRTLMRHLQPGA